MAETAKISQLSVSAKADLSDASIMEISADGASWQVSVAVLLELLLERGALTLGDAGQVILTVGGDDYTITAGALDVPTAFKVAGVQVVGAQQAKVDSPAGGAIIDAEGRAATDAIIAVLEAHGLTADA